MKAARRESKLDSERLLKEHERDSSFKTPRKGVFSSFRRNTSSKSKLSDEEYLAPTPPITPDEKVMDVNVFANEYDPTMPYGLESTRVSGLTKEDLIPGAEPTSPMASPMAVNRKVDFDDAPTVSLYSPPNSPGANTIQTREGGFRCGGEPDSVINQTLGFFDDLCIVGEENPNSNLKKHQRQHSSEGTSRGGQSNEWGTVPSGDEDESTFPSVQSTLDETNSLGYTNSRGPSTLRNSATVGESTLTGPSTSQGDSNKTFLQVPPLQRDSSHEHENFEVVLDVAQLNGSEPSEMYEQPASNVTATDEIKPKTRKSLVKRLFGRNKKSKDPTGEALNSTTPVEQPVVEDEEERAIFIPEADTSQDQADASQDQPKPRYLDDNEQEDDSVDMQRVATLDIASPPLSPRETQLSATTTNSANDEIFSVLESIFGGLNMDPAPAPTPVEEEKKEDDMDAVAMAGVTTAAASIPVKSLKYESEEVGPEDETDANASPERLARNEDDQLSVAITVESRDAISPTPSSASRKKAKKRGWGIAKALGIKKKSSSAPSDPLAASGTIAPTPTVMHESKTTSRSVTPAADSCASAPVKKSKKNKPLWKTAVDPKTGKTYWYNRETRVSTYNPPPEAFASIPTPTEDAPPEAKAALVPTPEPKKKKNKPAWKAVVDKNSGRTYYYHRKTRETTWTMPEELQKAVDSQTPAVETHKEAPVDNKVDLSEEKEIDPPTMVEAEVTPESQDRISRGEQGLLGTSFEKTEPAYETTEKEVLAETKQEIESLLLQIGDGSSAEVLLQEYEGKEDLLLQQLRDKLEARPFDEPEDEDASLPVLSPPRLANRSMTFASKASAATRGSTRTEKTERIRNTMKKTSLFDPISETQSTTTSLSSRHGDSSYLTPRRYQKNHARAVEARIPSRVPVHRERELKVEDLTTTRKTAENFDKYEHITRSPVQHHTPQAYYQDLRQRDSSPATLDELDEGSYMGDNEVDTYGTDSVSALSEGDTDFSQRKENFEQARRRALDDAIEREDWDLAAALSEGMKASNDVSTTGDYAKAHSTWNQSDLDKFIANNDWHAVKSYISRMKETKATDGPRTGLPPRPPSVSNNVDPTNFSKRIGSRSQLQHKRLLAGDSSWTTGSEGSYDSEESSETDYS